LELCVRAGGDSLTPEQRTALDGLQQTAYEMGIDTLLQTCRDLAVLPEDFADRSPDEARQYLARLNAHNHAMDNYAVQPISIPVHLFAAEEQPPVAEGETPDPLLGWGAVVPASQIVLATVPGDHFSIMEAPHITALGQAISRALERTRSAPVAAPEVAYRPQLTIQTGQRGYTPIFCVPGAGDNVIGFNALAGALGGAWPVQGLQPRGVEGAYVPHVTVEAAARVYVQALDAVHPTGPVHLLGHSFGGWIAFEMAHQLRASGRAVASLTIIDSEAPGSAAILGREYTHLGVLVEMVRLLELIAEKSLGIDAAQLQCLDQAGQLKLLHERMVAVGLMPRRSEPDALHGTLRTFAAALRTVYRPLQTYPAPVRLVLVRDTSLDEASDRRQHQEILAGWRRWAPEVTYWRGPGNHFTVLKAPNVQTLADWWRREVQSDGEKKRPELS
jgi:thioesterase domain-containing protein